MKTPTPLVTALILTCLWPAAHALDAVEKPAPEQLDFFEKKIRPVLSEHCYKCHSEKSEKIRGGLVLDSREGIRRGGDNGPAVVPGDLKESLLLEAIHHTNTDFAMPPEKEGPKLSDAVIKDFEAWVKMGAPDPRDGAAKVVAKYDDAAARQWWSFQAVQKPAVPAPKNAAWPKTEIDQFLLAGLEAKGLAPVADADPATLLRRVYFDLIGLPPAPQEIDAFLKDRSPQVFEKVVDRLLALPQFGERWGRHWLDVARYAESTGKDVNIALPHAWRYRDYVIGAFNADKPYDQFIQEQIAGDLLTARDDQDKADKLVATGFLAIGPKSLNERNPKQFAMDVADEQIDTMSQAILGLTISCARCHDHKFDPVPQRDYYALAGIFLSTETRYGTIPGIQNGNPTPLIELPKEAKLPTTRSTLAADERTQLERDLADARKQREEMVAEGMRMRTAAQSGKAEEGNPAAKFVQIQAAIARAAFFESELNAFDATGEPKAFGMGAQDKPSREVATRQYSAFMRSGPEAMRKAMADRMKSGQPFRRPSGFEAINDSPLFARGEVEKPGDRVPRGFPTVLTASTPPTISPTSSGRRELAEWLVSPRNPLTARVMVNRAWHWLFGRGLVESVDNFGTTGQQPSNQGLLDHLASDFIADGWSVKRLIKDLVMSRAYQLSSTHDEKSFAADPGNALVWRMSKRRLDAECVRDAMLASSGHLDLTPPVGSIIGRAGDSAIGGPRGRGVGEEAIIHAAGSMRSVYLPIAREVVPDSLAVFDFAETSLVTGARETTNVPSQALYLLNSTFVSLQAQALADRVLTAGTHFDARLAYAYWLVFTRGPDAVERKAAADFFGKFPSNWKKGDAAPMGMRDADDVKAAWTSFSRALFASAEFRYLN